VKNSAICVLNIKMRTVEVVDRIREVTTDMFQYIFAFIGFDAPRLFPTKLDVEKPIPSANIYNIAIVLMIITLVPNCVSPR